MSADSAVAQFVLAVPKVELHCTSSARPPQSLSLHWLLATLILSYRPTLKNYACSSSSLTSPILSRSTGPSTHS